ncbi:MAG: hypothetical protein LBC33_00870, partial [Mycoplasmataceae bacterium]|nr:hypothetical protein [Mycoplasmataceae bacterium]
YFNWILSNNQFTANCTKYVSPVELTNLQLSAADLQEIADIGKQLIIAKLNDMLIPEDMGVPWAIYWEYVAYYTIQIALLSADIVVNGINIMAIPPTWGFAIILAAISWICVIDDCANFAKYLSNIISFTFDIISIEIYRHSFEYNDIYELFQWFITEINVIPRIIQEIEPINEFITSNQFFNITYILLNDIVSDVLSFVFKLILSIIESLVNLINFVIDLIYEAFQSITAFWEIGWDSVSGWFFTFIVEVLRFVAIVFKDSNFRLFKFIKKFFEPEMLTIREFIINISLLIAGIIIAVVRSLIITFWLPRIELLYSKFVLPYINE